MERASVPLKYPSGKGQNRFQHCARLRIPGRIIKLFQFVKRDELIKWEAALNIQLDQLRDKYVRNAIPLDNPTQRASKKDAIHIQGYLSPQWRGPNQPAYAGEGQTIHGLA